MSLGFWDFALLGLVGGQATLLSYLSHPKWKALILVLPIPFTLAALAVGSPVNTTHVAALNLLLAYTHGVRLLHNRARLPIIPAIVLSAAGYCGFGVLLRPLMPQSEIAFWLACILTLGIAALTHAFYTCPEEPGHRTHLPVWVKFPLVVGVIFLLLMIKGLLGGFMTMFPMVGVMASYEARTSLGSARFHVRHGPDARGRSSGSAETRVGPGLDARLARFYPDADPAHPGFLEAQKPVVDVCLMGVGAYGRRR
jgi:hypothetical protein